MLRVQDCVSTLVDVPVDVLAAMMVTPATACWGMGVTAEKISEVAIVSSGITTGEGSLTPAVACAPPTASSTVAKEMRQSNVYKTST